jgi:hypothetical protein
MEKSRQADEVQQLVHQTRLLKITDDGNRGIA